MTPLIFFGITMLVFSGTSSILVALDIIFHGNGSERWRSYIYPMLGAIWSALAGISAILLQIVLYLGSK